MEQTQTENQTSQQPKKQIDYSRILRRAYDITIQHKFLWVFGALIALGSGGGNFNGGGGSGESVTPQEQEFFNKIDGFANQYWLAIIALVAFVFLLLIVIWVMGTISRGALIDSANKVDDGIHADIKSGFHRGLHFFWRIFGIGLVFFALMMVVLAVILTPVIYFIVMKQFAPAIFIGIMGLLFFIPIAMFFGIISQLALLFAVMMERRVFAAISEAYDLLFKNFSAVGLLWLLSIGIGIVGSVVTFFFALPLILIAVPFALGSYAAFQLSGLVITIAVSVIIFMVVMAIVRGVFEVYLQTFWILGFKELMGEKIKAEENQKVAAETAASAAPAA